MWRDKFFRFEGNVSLPIRFLYNGICSDEFLPTWRVSTARNKKKGFEEVKLTFQDNTAASGLTVLVDVLLYDAYPAADFKIHIENNGECTSGLIENISSIALRLDKALCDGTFILHKSFGGLSTPDDFVQSDIVLCNGDSTKIETFGGRSSNKDNPYFTLDTGDGRLVVAIGWSGQWKCSFDYIEGGLSVAGGMEDSHFRLYPGEKVSLPSVVALFCDGNIDRAYSDFRRLVLENYVPELPERDKQPYVFCNTCFTRGGGWLNECNEDNQISLIKSLKPLHTESVITDAGWFVGGWPSGAGNWDTDPEKYPNGIEPVTVAAKENGMRYGLWFELERVVSGTQFALEHPELMLSVGSDTLLADMGKPETVDYMYSIVEKLFNIRNFSCYRQDFNMEPLDYWRANDASDRIGITELKYINGLYTFLDRIRTNYPEIFMDGCSSGGRRLDIGMIKRFHTHQKTDLWFNNTIDQNSVFSLSHYLPNVSFTAHVNRYDDYTFNSVMGATLCLGWIADSDTETWNGNEAFSSEKAGKLMERYNKVRPYLNCDFYPLTPPDQSDSALIAFQFINEAEQKGVVFIYKREQNKSGRITLNLHSIDTTADVLLTELTDNSSCRASGDNLANGYEIILPSTPDSKVIFFEKVN